MLVVVALQQTPDMYQLSFSSRNEMEQWISALTTAQKLAPKYGNRPSVLECLNFMFSEISQS